jgi:hypothetical protein
VIRWFDLQCFGFMMALLGVLNDFPLTLGLSGHNFVISPVAPIHAKEIFRCDSCPKRADLKIGLDLITGAL